MTEIELKKRVELQKKMKISQNKGLSVREIAKKFKVSTGRVSNYLNDKMPKISKPKKKVKSKILTESQKLYNRDRQYTYRYGITLEDYFKMYKLQGGTCAICKTSKPISGNYKMEVDHCHNTGKVRGLLCSKCNTALGQFKDSEEILTTALSYVKNSKYAKMT